MTIENKIKKYQWVVKDNVPPHEVYKPSKELYRNHSSFLRGRLTWSLIETFEIKGYSESHTYYVKKPAWYALHKRLAKSKFRILYRNTVIFEGGSERAALDYLRQIKIWYECIDLKLENKVKERSLFAEDLRKEERERNRQKERIKKDRMEKDIMEKERVRKERIEEDRLDRERLEIEERRKQIEAEELEAYKDCYLDSNDVRTHLNPLIVQSKKFSKYIIPCCGIPNPTDPEVVLSAFGVYEYLAHHPNRFTVSQYLNALKEASEIQLQRALGKRVFDDSQSSSSFSSLPSEDKPDDLLKQKEDLERLKLEEKTQKRREKEIQHIKDKGKWDRDFKINQDNGWENEIRSKKNQIISNQNSNNNNNNNIINNIYNNNNNDYDEDDDYSFNETNSNVNFTNDCTFGDGQI